MCSCLSPNKTGKQILLFVSDYEETYPEDGTTFVFELLNSKANKETPSNSPKPMVFPLPFHPPYIHLIPTAVKTSPVQS